MVTSGKMLIFRPERSRLSRLSRSDLLYQHEAPPAPPPSTCNTLQMKSVRVVCAPPKITKSALSPEACRCNKLKSNLSPYITELGACDPSLSAPDRPPTTMYSCDKSNERDYKTTYMTYTASTPPRDKRLAQLFPPAAHCELYPRAHRA
ncbi:hypothetical protein EVAR_23724_1 [Eumeta japonica]|uniref:Uncharacterized protein n=1 Tax=Eumeta variegata TaxID=151549 RepID=A0A4C1VIZ8_EUMVA|nr:hypothetical protein EVAR_23724_1 [Eumeta japonica]